VRAFNALLSTDATSTHVACPGASATVSLLTTIQLILITLLSYAVMSDVCGLFLDARSELMEQDTFKVSLNSVHKCDLLNSLTSYRLIGSLQEGPLCRTFNIVLRKKTSLLTVTGSLKLKHSETSYYLERNFHTTISSVTYSLTKTRMQSLEANILGIDRASITSFLSYLSYEFDTLDLMNLSAVLCVRGKVSV